MTIVSDAVSAPVPALVTPFREGQRVICPSGVFGRVVCVGKTGRWVLVLKRTAAHWLPAGALVLPR